MKTHLRVWDIPLLNALPLAIVMVVSYVYWSYVPKPDSALVAIFETRIVRLLVGWPVLFAINLAVGYLMCFATKKWGFMVTASAMAVLMVVLSFLPSGCDYILYVLLPLLAILAKRMRDRDRILNLVAGVALLCVTGFVAYVIYIGRSVAEPCDDVLLISRYACCAVVAGSWLSYYLMPRFVLPALYLLALILLFAFVPVVSWQIFILPATLTLIFLCYHNKWYIALFVRKRKE